MHDITICEDKYASYDTGLAHALVACATSCCCCIDHFTRQLVSVASGNESMAEYLLLMEDSAFTFYIH